MAVARRGAPRVGALLLLVTGLLAAGACFRSFTVEGDGGPSPAPRDLAGCTRFAGSRAQQAALTCGIELTDDECLLLRFDDADVVTRVQAEPRDAFDASRIACVEAQVVGICFNRAGSGLGDVGDPIEVCRL